MTTNSNQLTSFIIFLQPSLELKSTLDIFCCWKKTIKYFHQSIFETLKTLHHKSQWKTHIILQDLCLTLNRNAVLTQNFFFLSLFLTCERFQLYAMSRLYIMHTLIYICVNSFWNILKPIFNSNSSVTILGVSERFISFQLFEETTEIWNLA